MSRTLFIKTCSRAIQARARRKRGRCLSSVATSCRSSKVSRSASLTFARTATLKYITTTRWRCASIYWRARWSGTNQTKRSSSWRRQRRTNRTSSWAQLSRKRKTGSKVFTDSSYFQLITKSSDPKRQKRSAEQILRAISRRAHKENPRSREGSSGKRLLRRLRQSISYLAQH